jgi:hypothetical protein
MTVAARRGLSRRRFCFVFVCQAGELEIKALLLAASLKRFLQCDYELVAAVPGPSDIWGELSSLTIETLSRLGVRFETIVNPIDVSYPIGNKLACLSIATSAEKIVFLDSDILCMRDFHDSVAFDVAFAAKPADLRTFSASRDAWAPLYASVGVDVPTRLVPTTVSGEFGLPYFNSGAVFVDVSADLGQAWIACAHVIDALAAMQPQRHWLDQVSLAVAVHKQGLRYCSLGETYNFPAHLKPIGDNVPVFCHYHWPKVLRSEPRLMELFAVLVAEYPEIANCARKIEEWSALLQAPADEKMSRRLISERPFLRDQIVIAGIPSATDRLLCDLLSSHENCLVVRECSQIDAALRSPVSPWDVAATLRTIRSDVLAGDGEFCEERVKLANDFVLVASNPLGFLCRFSEVKRVLPSTRMIICVDSPFSTIAGWKTGDSVLRDADMTCLGLVGAQWLSVSDSMYLKTIAEASTASNRRAMLWWWLAQRVLSYTGQVMLVTRNDLKFRQRETLQQIFDGTRPGQFRQSTLPMTPEEDSLDDEDRQAIRAICTQPASELGV